MSGIWGLALTAALLALNAFFVGAEFALVSARRTMIQPRAERGSRRARATLTGMENVSLMMAGAQLGITVCSLALGSVSEPVIAQLLEHPLHALGAPLVHALAFAVALALITFLHVVVGEMVPKNLALAGPDRAALALAPPLLAVVRVLHPPIRLLNLCANAVLRVLRVDPKEELTSAFTRDQVAELAAESRSGGLIDARDEQLVLDALAFEARQTSAVLIPTAALRSLPLTVSPAQAETVAARSFSRFPLTDSAGSLTGYIHIKDVLETDPVLRARPIPADRIRRLPVVLLDAPLAEVLKTMKSSGAHLAGVVDHDGRQVGAVALEDVLEELVGQIRDDSRRTPG